MTAPNSSQARPLNGESASPQAGKDADFDRLMAMSEAEIDAELRSHGLDPVESAAKGAQAISDALLEVQTFKAADAFMEIDAQASGDYLLRLTVGNASFGICQPRDYSGAMSVKFAFRRALLTLLRAALATASPATPTPPGIEGLVFAVAFGNNREISAMFDSPEQAHAFVAWLKPFTKDVPVTLGGGPPGDHNGEKAAARAVIASAVQAIPAVEPVREWQAIETAPKDGTRVLLWIVHPNAKFAADPIFEGWAGECVGAWIDFNSGGWSWHGHMGEATHWAPLPPPPVNAGRSIPPATPETKETTK